VSTYHARTPGLGAGLRREPPRLVSRTAATFRRLGHEATVGESAATPAILVAGMAVCMWTLAALLIAAAVAARALLGWAPETTTRPAT